MRIFGKFPLVRMRQLRDNPQYAFFWLMRVLWHRKHSYRYVSKYDTYNPLSPSDTLAHIIQNKKSIIRFGDGEFGVLSGAGIYPPDSDWSQRYSNRLKSELIRLMESQDEKILLAFPAREVVTASAQDAAQVGMIGVMHTETRLFLWKLIQRGKIYGDWGVFLPQHNPSLSRGLLTDYLKDKVVVVVTGGTDNLSEVTLGKETLFIECGKNDAFERLDQVNTAIDSCIRESNLTPDGTLFMVSLGCSSGFVIEHIVRQGFVGWDTGHIFRFVFKKENGSA